MDRKGGLEGHREVNEAMNKCTGVGDDLRGELEESDELLELMKTGRLLGEPVAQQFAQEIELFKWETCLHGYGVDFKPNIFQFCAGKDGLGVLKAEAKLGTQILAPLHSCIGNREWCIGREGQEEIIKVMVKITGDMMLNDPVEGLSKEVKYIGCWLDPEHENHCIIEVGVPGEAKERPVVGPNRNMTECILKVELGEEGPLAKTADRLQGGFECLVTDFPFCIRDAIIYWVAIRPGEMIDEMLFRIPFACSSSKGRGMKVGKRRWIERAMGHIFFQKGIDCQWYSARGFWSRFEVSTVLQAIRSYEAESGTMVYYVQDWFDKDWVRIMLQIKFPNILN